MKALTKGSRNNLAMARNRAMAQTRRRPVRVETRAIAFAKAALAAARTQAHERRVGQALNLMETSFGAAAFDPTEPKDGALIVADVLRDQFIALFDAIQDCATEAELTAAVNSLNSDIAQRATHGEVTDAMNYAVTAATNTILPQTSNSTNGVPTLDISAYGYYDQWQIQSLIDKVNELINALRRY